MDRRSFVHRTAGGLAALGALRALSACRPDAPAPAEDAEFVALRERYFLTTLELNPVTSTYLGGDGYSPTLAAVNGKLRDFSPAALGGEVAFLQSVLTALAAMPVGTLSPQARIDHAVVTAQAGYMVHQLAELRYHERCVDTYVAEPFRGIDWQIQGMTDAGNGLLGTEAEWALVVARAGAVPAYVETAKANLLAGKAAGNMPDRRLVARDGIAGAKANVEYFTTTLPGLAAQYIGDRPFGPALIDQLKTAGAAAGAAYASMANFLGSTYDAKEDDGPLRGRRGGIRLAGHQLPPGSAHPGRALRVRRVAGGGVRSEDLSRGPGGVHAGQSRPRVRHRRGAAGQRAGGHGPPGQGLAEGRHRAVRLVPRGGHARRRVRPAAADVRHPRRLPAGRHGDAARPPQHAPTRRTTPPRRSRPPASAAST